MDCRSRKSPLLADSRLEQLPAIRGCGNHAPTFYRRQQL
jgi:hypothetical protein